MNVDVIGRFVVKGKGEIHPRTGRKIAEEE
jgi:hypothetical protein